MHINKEVSRGQCYRGSFHEEVMLILGNPHDWCPNKVPVLQCRQHEEQQEELELGVPLQGYVLIGIKET